MTEPQRYFFVHMQKTAGTALAKRLRLHFDRSAIYPLARDARTVESSIDIDLVRREFGERRDEVRLIIGHFPLSTTELLGVPFGTFTVLRDPVERTLSFLRDNKQRDPTAGEKSFEEIYADRVLFQGLIQNHMVKMLSLRAEELTAAGTMAPVDLDEAHLERAKRNLVERIDVMGLQEHFEEFCLELERRFGFDLGPSQFANRTKPMETPDGLRERIVRDNELDIELYRFAVQLRQDRLAKESSRDANDL
jgi:hypothetical protein